MAIYFSVRSFICFCLLDGYIKNISTAKISNSLLNVSWTKNLLLLEIPQNNNRIPNNFFFISRILPDHHVNLNILSISCGRHFVHAASPVPGFVSLEGKTCFKPKQF